jgi:hypothetical protein
MKRTEYWSVVASSDRHGQPGDPNMLATDGEYEVSLADAVRPEHARSLTWL